MIIQVWHADSLAGPLSGLKKAFAERSSGVEINTVSGRSRELAERISKGETCDVFASSDPAVVKEMFAKKIGSLGAASWYVVFSANELVVIVGRGNPLGLTQMTDLAREGIRLARVTGEKDMAAGRSVEFIKKASAWEGHSDLSQGIIDGALRESTIPEVLAAVKNGRADAGIVYLSAAVTIADSVEILSFPAEVNLSRDIRNAVTIPGTAENGEAALGFIRFMLSAEGRRILQDAGQPPLIPPLKGGDVPRELDLQF